MPRSPAARRGSPWSISTMAMARPAPRCGCSTHSPAPGAEAGTPGRRGVLAGHADPCAARPPMHRREFLRATRATPALTLIGNGAARGADGAMPQRGLGRTGETVSLVGLGGAHIGIQADKAESIRIIRTALDRGINFLDNSWDYHGGESERRMGEALQEG